MGYIPPFTISSKILLQVSDIVELLVELKQINSNFNTPKLRKKNRIKSITGTLQIEGNSFSEEKVTSVIDGKTVLGTMRELSEVQGAIKAYDYLESYSYKNQKDLLLCHNFLMDELLKNAGNYRDTNVAIGGKTGVTHVAPPPFNVPKLMNELFEWLKDTKEHPLIVSCIFHYEFEFIHPFSDGNGRVGRLWQTVILNSYKSIFGHIPIESVVRDNQKSYYKALENSGSTGESTPFIEFMLDVILKTLKRLENSSVPISVPANVPIKRLENIIKLIKKDKSITTIQIANRLKVSDKTIKRDLTKLKKQNIILRVGSNKDGYWELIIKEDNR